MRRWLHVDLNLGGLGLGPAEATELGNLPAVTLPAIAMLLGAFYEADNTPEAADKDKDKGKKDEKSGKPAGKVRVAAEADADAADEELEEPKKAKK
jgi:hypothetical protein